MECAKMRNQQSKINKDIHAHPNPLTISIVTIFSILLLTACDAETTYVGFGQSYHNLLFDSDNYDTYLASTNPQSSEFFYECLDKHTARHNNEAQIRINACFDKCSSDSVCNFNCNIEQGTEFFEARRDLLILKKATLQQNLDTEVLKLQGFILGEFECLSVNILRSFQGLPGLSCAEIAAQIKNETIANNQCTFKKNIFKRISDSDWDIQ
jgi:hypothetical protein